MTLKEFALMLDGRQYRNEITKDEEALAKALGFVVVFGYSDDNAELRGAIDDELSCFDGGELEHGDLPDKIYADWCPKDFDCSWVYMTDIPHEHFRIYEGDDLYCIGIVCDISKPKQTHGDQIRAMSDKELANLLASKMANIKEIEMAEKGFPMTATQLSLLASRLRDIWLQWLRQPAEVDNG